MRVMRKTILITGASSGLGRGMAREFAQRGRDLALCARRLDRLEDLRAELLAAQPGLRIAVRALDVNDHAQVFAVFRELDVELGGLDRIIVNAGAGRGRAIGKGGFSDNLETAQTNFIAALAQCEGALELFRARGRGHLVTIASMSAMRGMPRSMTTYAASKAALAHLSEGMRADLLGTPIKVTTVFPGYIRSEITERVKKAPFIIDAERGCRLLVRAIEREPASACVPRWPWVPLGFALRHLPLRLTARMN